MKRRNSSKRFWAVLTSFNLLTMIYPIVNLVTADTNPGQFISAVLLLSVLFMLGLVDTVAILIAYSA